MNLYWPHPHSKDSSAYKHIKKCACIHFPGLAWTKVMKPNRVMHFDGHSPHLSLTQTPSPPLPLPPPAVKHILQIFPGLGAVIMSSTHHMYRLPRAARNLLNFESENNTRSEQLVLLSTSGADGTFIVFRPSGAIDWHASKNLMDFAMSSDTCK